MVLEKRVTWGAGPQWRGFQSGGRPGSRAAQSLGSDRTPSRAADHLDLDGAFSSGEENSESDDPEDAVGTTGGRHAASPGPSFSLGRGIEEGGTGPGPEVALIELDASKLPPRPPVPDISWAQRFRSEDGWVRITGVVRRGGIRR